MEVIVGLILLVCILFGVGYMYRRKIYKEVDRLEARKIEIMNRSIIDELSKVKELKMVGQAEELFDQWRGEWDEIITTQLPEIEELLFEAEDYSDKYRFTKSKNVLQHIEKVLTTVDENIDKIISEINELVSSEENNSIESEEIKLQIKKVKKTLLAHSYQFGKAHVHLESQLVEISEALKQFDSETDEGNYLAAREMLLKVKKDLDILQSKTDDIPKFLTECNITLPNLLNELEEGYKEMVENGYYLEHIQVELEIEKINKQLAEYRKQLENADIEDIGENLQATQESIDTIYDLLEKEVEATLFVKQAKEKINSKLIELSEQNSASIEETDLVKQSYQLSDTELDRQKRIEKQLIQIQKKFEHINQNLHNDHVAHSIIKDELGEIDRQISKLLDDHNEYRDMLQALRKDELQARESLNKLKRVLLDASRSVYQSNIPGLPADFVELIDKAKSEVQKVTLKLDELPLNMILVNQLLEGAIQSVESLKNFADEIIEQVTIVEKVIQYGNRYRSRHSSLDAKFREAEELFRKYEYSKSLEAAAAAIEQVEPGSMAKIQEIIKDQKPI